MSCFVVTRRSKFHQPLRVPCLFLRALDWRGFGHRAHGAFLYIYIYIYIYILNVIILYDIILYYTILYYTILYYTMQILYLSAVARLRCTCCLFHALCRCGLIALTPNIMLRYITLHQIASHPITQIMLHCACCSNEDPAKSGLKSKRNLNVEGGLS